MRIFAFNQSEHHDNDALRCKFFAFFLAESHRLLACMTHSTHSTSSPSSDNTAEADACVCAAQTRRTLLIGALATTACIAGSGRAAAGEDPPGADERPQNGDVLVFSEGDREGKLITLADLPLGGPPVHAWPKDPKTLVVRSGSRLNEIL